MPRHLVTKMTGTVILVCALLVFSPATYGDDEHPLQPPDRSSPRATLQTFLNSADSLAGFVTEEYMPSASLELFQILERKSRMPVGCLDLSEIPESARRKAGGAAAMALYDTLNRITLPAPGEIPGASQLAAADDGEYDRWVIPHTEIALVRINEGAQVGQYLFSADTVARASEFRDRVSSLPLNRDVPHADFGEMMTRIGGWPLPVSWIESMPSWLLVKVAGQAAWKWLGLTILLVFYVFSIKLVHSLTRKVDPDRVLLAGWVRLGMPAFILLSTFIFIFMASVTVNLFGTAASVVGFLGNAIIFLAAAWLAWRAAPVIGETIIASPVIAADSVDGYVVKITARLLGLTLVAVLLVVGAERVGVPIYGIIAGLGVGGLAIALAAQPTVENLIGSLSIFADKPFQVGDRCRYGDQEGFVESIGIRSTRIRDFERRVTTIPNRDLSNMPLVNYSLRDRRLINSVIGVRYETTADQLRFVLAKVREMLISHPKINRNLLHVRLANFGASSLDIEIFAYVRTRDRQEFYAIREDIYLRIIDIIEGSGTSIAFPSRTVYFGRDPGLNAESLQEAENQVRQWREKGELPFPVFSREQIARVRASIEYPPPGSVSTEDE